MFDGDFLRLAAIRLPILIFSLTVHEFFHAWTANKFGDTTAKDMGRMTLNPLAHLDLFGTIVMVVSQFRFGWAKPVPVNPFNLRNPRKADLWISAAGPISNIGMALVAGILYRMVVSTGMDISPMAIEFLRFGVIINVILALFNMLPLFPLDGSHVLRSLLPPEMTPKLQQLDRFGPFVLIILMISGLLWTILWPPVGAVISLILGS